MIQKISPLHVLGAKLSLGLHPLLTFEEYKFVANYLRQNKTPCTLLAFGWYRLPPATSSDGFAPEWWQLTFEERCRRLKSYYDALGPLFQDRLRTAVQYWQKREP